MTNTIMSKTLMAAAAVALTTVSFASTANAETRITRTAVVDYSDLDLNSDEGRSTFQGRIKGAVRKVCGTFSIRQLNERKDHSNCVDEANLSAKRASVTIMAAAAAGRPIETAMAFKN